MSAETALSNFITKPVKLLFLKTSVPNDSSDLLTSTSREEIVPSSSSLYFIVVCSWYVHPFQNNRHWPFILRYPDRQHPSTMFTAKLDRVNSISSLQREVFTSEFLWFIITDQEVSIWLLWEFWLFWTTFPNFSDIPSGLNREITN